jgi:hypothetical protein
MFLYILDATDNMAASTMFQTVRFLLPQETEWVQSYPLGTVNHVVRPNCGKYSGYVLSSLIAPVDALDVYRDVMFSNA